MPDPDRTIWDDPQAVAMSNQVAMHAVAHATAELEAKLAAQRRLIRWLSLTYGENLPIFHGPGKVELERTYTDALAEDDGDPAFWWAAEQRTAKADPDGPYGTPKGAGAYEAHEELMRIAPPARLRRRWWRR